jgi:hypothetical protein
VGAADIPDQIAQEGRDHLDLVLRQRRIDTSRRGEQYGPSHPDRERKLCRI